MSFDGMAKWEVTVDLVTVPSPFADASDVPGGLELRDDPLYRALGDAHPVGDVAHAGLGVLDQT